MSRIEAAIKAYNDARIYDAEDSGPDYKETEAKILQNIMLLQHQKKIVEEAEILEEKRVFNSISEIIDIATNRRPPSSRPWINVPTQRKSKGDELLIQRGLLRYLSKAYPECEVRVAGLTDLVDFVNSEEGKILREIDEFSTKSFFCILLK